ncbi:MAG: hypothetical protein LBS83_03065 [Holosporales bacterium]|jgi:hypoxanthine phosphoribosyltransferase|nr:hypothetical protein [Holosporales bacterium]
MKSLGKSFLNRVLASVCCVSLCGCVASKKDLSVKPAIKSEVKEIAELMNTSKVLYTNEQIQKAINKIANEMNAKFKGENPIIVCTLKGALPFFGQLLTKLDFDLQVDCLYISSFKGKEREKLKWGTKPNINCSGRVVILVDDILDTGKTLELLVDFYKKNGAKKVYTAVLLDKKCGEKKNGLKKADFVGIEAKNVFVIGFGLDYHDYCRNFSDIYEVK